MPYSKVNNSVSGLDRMAKTVAVPRDYKAERIPTFPALERTGVLSFTDTSTVTVPTASTLEAMVCRDPAYPVWVTEIPSDTPFSFYTMLTGTGDAIKVTQGAYSTIPIGPLSNTYSSPGSFLALRDYTMPTLKYNAEHYFYNVTGIMGVCLRFDVTPGACEAAFSVATLDSTGNVTNHVHTSAMFTSTTTVGFAINLPSQTIGFRLVSLEVASTVTATLTSAAYGLTTTIASSATALISPTDTCRRVLFPITKPVEAVSTTVPWKAVRSTAVGALFSNVTAVLNKEGTIKAARISSEILSPLSSADFNTAIDKVYPKDRYFGAMENGLYTYTLPDLGSETYRDTLDYGVQLISPVWSGVFTPGGIFDLDKLSYFNMIVFTDIGSNDSTLAVTIDRHIEFRSSSVLFPLGYSTYPLETYHAAQMALVQLGVFFENPLHMGLIGSAVSQAVRAVASYAYPVVKQVGRAAIAAAGDKILDMANKKLGQMTQAKFAKPSPQQPLRVKARPKRAKAKVQRRK